MSRADCLLLNKKGFVLLGVYLLSALALGMLQVFSMRALTQGMLTNRYVRSMQALDLAQAGLEQFRYDLSVFLHDRVYLNPQTGPSNTRAMQWLDNLEQGNESPLFDPYAAPPAQTRLPFRSGDLPSALQPASGGSFEVRLDAPNNPVRPTSGGDPAAPCQSQSSGCDVVVLATGEAGGVRRTIRATIRFPVESARAFEYLYFMNNYGYFQGNPQRYDIRLHGSLRSNGDLRIGYINALNGDVYASANPDLPGNPTGNIVIDPDGTVANWTLDDYLNINGVGGAGGTHPPISPYLRDQPDAIPTNLDDPHAGPYAAYTGTMHQHSGLDPLEMPALGDLSEQMAAAVAYGNGAGSRLRFWSTGPNGIRGDADDREINIVGAYDGVGDYYRLNDGTYGTATHALDASGPDGVPGTPDDGTLLITGGYGCGRQGPLYCGGLEVNGPVVIPGDAIITGATQKGQGMIYAGRNVHITGTIWHGDTDLTRYPLIEQHNDDPTLFRASCNNFSGSILSSEGTTDGSLAAVQAWAASNCP